MTEIKADNIDDILNSPFGSLTVIKNKYSEKEVQAILTTLIIGLLKSFNYSRQMNTEQVVRLVNMIIECYPHYRIEDFKRCFKRMVRGFYGRFFEGMDENKILDCIEKYDLERENEIIELRKRQSDEMKVRDKELLNEAILPVLKSVVEKKEEVKKEVKIEREKTDGEKLMQQWFKEFDEEHLKQKQPITDSIRMIVYKGKSLSINGFINTKLEEKYSK